MIFVNFYFPKIRFFSDSQYFHCYKNSMEIPLLLKQAKQMNSKIFEFGLELYQHAWLINKFWENKCIFLPGPCCVLQRGLSHKGPWGKDHEWVPGSDLVDCYCYSAVTITQLLLQPQRNYWLADSGTPGEGEGTMRNHHIKIQCKVKACLEQEWMTQQETCFQDLVDAFHNLCIKQKAHTYYLLEIIP